VPIETDKEWTDRLIEGQKKQSEHYVSERVIVSSSLSVPAVPLFMVRAIAGDVRRMFGRRRKIKTFVTPVVAIRAAVIELYGCYDGRPDESKARRDMESCGWTFEHQFEEFMPLVCEQARVCGDGELDTVAAHNGSDRVAEVCTASEIRRIKAYVVEQLKMKLRENAERNRKRWDETQARGKARMARSEDEILAQRRETEVRFFGPDGNPVAPACR
jgi:hypothetical protein